MITSSELVIASCEVARRRHREAHVGTPTYDLRLVVHDHGPAAALHDHVSDSRGLSCVLVVRDDRDDVVGFDRHAYVDHKRRVLVARNLQCLPSRSPSFGCELGKHVARETLHLIELVDRAESADEVRHAGLSERANPLRDLLGPSPTGPQLERSIACDSSG